MQPYNPSTKTVYQGVNNLILCYQASERGYDDPRFLSAKQIKKLGYELKPKPENYEGYYSFQVEFYCDYDIEKKRKITPQELHDIKRFSPERLEDIKPSWSYYNVYNGDQINGLPPLEIKKPNLIELNKSVDNIVKELKVGFKEGGNKASYNFIKDQITMPLRSSFFDDYFYNATLLHELGHSTGHTSRLDRKIANHFGSEDYAIEELRAEIASSFVSQELGLKCDQQHLDSHKAYIQSWISKLQSDPNELFRAIKDANKISDYLLDRSGLERMKNKVKNQPFKNKGLERV